jgi:hypothetical protein
MGGPGENVSAPVHAVLDEVELAAYVSYDTGEDLVARFLDELNRLSAISKHDTINRDYSQFPTVLRFSFLLSLTSRAALRLARWFMTLPCQTTVLEYYKDETTTVQSSLTNLDCLEGQIDTFIKMSKLPAGELTSLADDAMAKSADRFYLPGKEASYSFVLYGQPLDRHCRCLPLYVLTANSGAATIDVRGVVDRVCASLTRWGLVVKYLCSDGDPGYDAYHRKFFAEWYPRFLEGGLEAALEYASQQTKLPVGDFPHLWKVFCNKIKNHNVTLSPYLLDPCSLSVNSLESTLNLGAALKDRQEAGLLRRAVVFSRKLLEVFRTGSNQRTHVPPSLGPPKRNASESQT